MTASGNDKELVKHETEIKELERRAQKSEQEMKELVDRYNKLALELEAIKEKYKSLSGMVYKGAAVVLGELISIVVWWLEHK